MTSITDSNVITASGGLVELGYSQITASVAPSATTAAGATSIIPNLTVVCDGSPVLVEFFAPSARCDATASDALSFTLKYDGSVQQDKWGQIGNNSTTAGHLFPVFLQYRMTPTAGSHTFSVGGYVTNASRVGYVGATSPLAPAFLRVSKIVQATQWPAVTTGTIVCTSTTRPSSPFAGQNIYETDTKKKYTYDGTSWFTEGLQYEATSTSQQTITTAADVTNITTGSSFTAISGRKYKATFYCSQASGTSGERINIAILAGASVVQRAYANLTTYGLPINIVGTFTGSGVTTIKVQAVRDVGTNSSLLYADANSPMKLLVEDIGPT